MTDEELIAAIEAMGGKEVRRNVESLSGLNRRRTHCVDWRRDGVFHGVGIAFPDGTPRAEINERLLNKVRTMRGAGWNVAA